MRTLSCALLVGLLGCYVALATAPRATADDKSGGKHKVITTKSGLKYEDVKTGTGAEAKKGETVTVEYTGWLKNGKKFDSSKDHGRPFSFELGQGRVIKGWDEGVQGMKVGGVRKLIIPANLAYGERGAGDVIPPNSELTFEVKLLKVGNE